MKYYAEMEMRGDQGETPEVHFRFLVISATEIRIHEPGVITHHNPYSSKERLLTWVQRPEWGGISAGSVSELLVKFTEHYAWCLDRPVTQEALALFMAYEV